MRFIFLHRARYGCLCKRRPIRSCSIIGYVVVPSCCHSFFGLRSFVTTPRRWWSSAKKKKNLSFSKKKSNDLSRMANSAWKKKCHDVTSRRQISLHFARFRRPIIIFIFYLASSTLFLVLNTHGDYIPGSLHFHADSLIAGHLFFSTGDTWCFYLFWECQHVGFQAAWLGVFRMMG